MSSVIIKSDKRIFTCRDIETGENFTATALGNLLKRGETLVVGDIVEVNDGEVANEKIIVEMEPRRNEIFRLLVRERKKKVIASNCDRLVIVMSASSPAYKRGLVDRYLVRAHQWGIRPIVVFNKMDEYSPDDFDIDFESFRLEELDIHSFEVSATTDGYTTKYLDRGLAELKEDLKGKTSIFLGHSGVGKSALITSLSSRQFELKSAEIAKSGKGSHTTTWAEIVSFGDFDMIDSPGVRSYSLDDIDPKELIGYFPDIEEVAVNCKFSDCSHQENSKGCFFFSEKAWQDNEKQHQALLTRLDSYLRLHEELAETPQWKKSY
jgi:ribosome biogenesis GTPase